MWNRFTEFDGAAAAWMNLHHSPLATAVMRLFTNLGSPLVITLLGTITVALLYWRGRRYQAFTVAAGLVGSWLLNELLKALFHRARPAGPWLTDAHGYSFPSGHSMVSISFFLVVAVTLSAGVAKRRWRSLIVAGGILVALVIGASRVYLGVHYATDVLAGFAVGAVWGLLCLLPWRRRTQLAAE